MSVDDEAARKARADRLHEQVDKITAPKTDPETPANKEAPAPAESPREFTNRKLIERLKGRPKE
jgi:hypothetical protein